MLEEHRVYLGDAARMAAFRRAVARVVRPGDVVLDLGAGTGILGILALRAGAGRVYAVERGPVLGVAREMVRAAGFAGRWVGIRGLSTDVELPERADVLLSDQVGCFGLDYGILGPTADARARHLRRGARLLPEAVEVHLALLSSPAAYRRVSFWDGAPAPVRRMAAHTMTFLHPRRGSLASAAGRVLAVDLRCAPAGECGGRTVLRASRAALVHGLIGFFRARLAPGIHVTNSPLATGGLRRSPVFLPLEEPLRVTRGQAVPVSLSARPDEGIFTWTVAGARHSSLLGRPLAAEELLLLRPGHRPRLSRRGEATALVLDLCRQGRTVEGMEAEVRRRFPGLAGEPGFVAGVLSGAALPGPSFRRDSRR